MCVYMFMCELTYLPANTHVSVCTEARVQCPSSSLIVLHLEIGSLAAMGELTNLSRLTGQPASGTLLAPHPQCWDYRCSALHPTFYAGAGWRAQVFLLLQQALYQLSLLWLYFSGYTVSRRLVFFPGVPLGSSLLAPIAIPSH